MLPLVTIGFACTGKSCVDQCGQVAARLSRNQQNQLAPLALDPREWHPSTTGMHNVDLFVGKTIDWESQLAINPYHAYGDNHEPSVVPTEIATSSPPEVLPFGTKDAKYLRRAYPLLPHGHEKAAWWLVDGGRRAM